MRRGKERGKLGDKEKNARIWESDGHSITRRSFLASHQPLEHYGVQYLKWNFKKPGGKTNKTEL